MTPDVEPDETQLRRAADGDPASWQAVVAAYRERLRRVAEFRLDTRLNARLDPSDVVQDTLVTASRRLDDYLSRPGVPFFVWLRSLAIQQIVDVHRRHLRADARDARRDRPIAGTDNDSAPMIAAGLAANLTSPSEAAARNELANRLHDALTQMDPADREVLALRHFEGLSNAEVSAALGLTVSAASKRYVRALERLREILTGLSGCEAAGVAS